MVQKQHKPRDVVVEVGFEKAGKLRELSSKNPDIVYIGMEVPSRVGKVESLRSNLILDYKGGLGGLIELPNESVNQVIMDLVLGVDFTLTDVEMMLTFPGTKFRELRFGDLDDRHAIAMHECFEFWRGQMLEQVKRVLKPDGTLEMNIARSDLKKIGPLLEKAGFTYESRPANDEEVSKSWYVSVAREGIKKGDKRFNAEEDSITHITAMKKPEKGGLRLLPPHER